MTKQQKREWAEGQVEKLTEAMKTKGIPQCQLANTLNHTTTGGFPLVALTKMDDDYRVVAAVAYVNRALRPQVSIYMEFFQEPGPARELYNMLVETDGCIIFGDHFKLSVGSGLRYVESFGPPQKVIRVRSE